MTTENIIKKLSLTDDDLKQLEEHDVSLENIEAQLKYFENGIETADLERPCSIGDGIVKLSEQEINYFSKIFDEKSNDKKLCKFVPASGAATRMFKDLISVYSNNENNLELAGKQIKESNEMLEAAKTIKEIKKFSFYDDLKNILNDEGVNIEEKISSGDHKIILEYLLFEKGLNLSNLPKGLIKFHSYEDKTRTAFEEHLAEAVNYTSDAGNTANIHFTISPEHLTSISEHINDVQSYYEAGGVKINVEFTTQKNSTDTIALNKNNKLARDIDGKILFRPSGHGALLDNLNSTDADIIFIKNIDNVLPDSLKEKTYTYKKVLGGILLKLQADVFNYLTKIDEDNIDEQEINELINFVKQDLQIHLPEDFDHKEMSSKKKYLFSKLNRPIRICGMVKNEGEPGGGPFWIKDKNGNVSKRIVEAAQINFNSNEQRKIFESSTHFNPVDIVCAVKNFKGIKFDLLKYRNPDLGILGTKSYNGENIRVLELPGLWNGGMHDWITLFIEVPLSTFNPVKTINDLLRPAHQ